MYFLALCISKGNIDTIKRNNQKKPTEIYQHCKIFLRVVEMKIGLQERLSKQQLLLNTVNKMEEHFPCTRICYDKFDL